MKRRSFLRTALLFLTILFSVCIGQRYVMAETRSNTVYIKFGDINFDGRINDADRVLLYQHITADKSPETYEKHPDWYLRNRAFTAADVNADGILDVTDFIFLLRHISAEKGENFISSILTITLKNTSTGEIYDCFPVIYEYGKTNYYPYLMQLYKTGYDFGGWYLGSKQISSYDVIDSAEDKTLIPYWSQTNYYLYFDANGGSCTTSYRPLVYGDYYGSLPTPERTGYTFTGWYTERNGGSQVSAYTTIGTQSITVYAHWNKNRYSVQFNVDGSPYTYIYADYGSSYGTLPVPEKTGYRFKGWYTEKTGGSRISEYTVMGAQNVVVYAQWEADQYCLKFWISDNNSSYRYINHGDIYGTLPVPEKTGYEFKGWYTAKSGGNKVSEYTVMEARDVVVYAQWEVKQYSLEFWISDNNSSYKYVDYGSPYGTLPVPKKTGYQFKGWYTEKTGGSKVSAQTLMEAGNVIVYAQWESGTKIKLNKTSLTIPVKKAYQLKATVSGTSGTVKWSSSNSKIVYVNSSGKIAAKKTGKATITAKVNGVKASCKVTVVKSLPAVQKFGSIRNQSYTYTNSRFFYGIGFAKTSNAVFLGVWNAEGISASYEDFYFQIKEGVYTYKVKGGRSPYIYTIVLKPYKDYVTISIKCNDASYTHFDIGTTTFKRNTDSSLAMIDYAESWGKIDIAMYCNHHSGKSYTESMKELAANIGGMKTGKKSKFPDFYCTGKNLVIGTNENAIYRTSKDEYIRVENNGNKDVSFYEVKIGDTRQEMEKKFSKYYVTTYDNGKTYSNANAWIISVKFSNGRLKSYVYLCKPTS